MRKPSKALVDDDPKSPLDHVLSVSGLLYTLGFLYFRLGELFPLLAYHGPEAASAFLNVFVLHRFLARRGRYLSHAAAMLALIYVLDHQGPKALPEAMEEYVGKTVVVTGANAGVGYEVSRQLAVDYGMNVIMGCRSSDKCKNAAAAIDEEIKASPGSKGSVAPLDLDLSDFQSVEAFASEGLGNRTVDVLLNNAGYAAGAGEPVNKYGLDPAFTSMHLSHFLLAELLLERNPKLRVVNTSSATHHLCALPFALGAFVPQFLLDNLPSPWKEAVPWAPGCVDDEYLEGGLESGTDGAAYFRAKLANVLHVVELPRRHMDATAIAIDLGWVGTNIEPFMQGSVTPASLGWMRSVDIGVRPVLMAVLTSRMELRSELGDSRKLVHSPGMIMNVFGWPEEAFVYPWWNDFGDKNRNLSRERMMSVGKNLWERSADLVSSRSMMR